MLILKYFKRVDNGSCLNRNTLPDPEGPLSTSVPSEAIATANERVRDVLNTISSDTSLDGYSMCIVRIPDLLLAK